MPLHRSSAEAGLFTAGDAVLALRGYIQRKTAGRYGDWYCGITFDPVARVYGAHRVRKSGLRKWCKGATVRQARAAERYLQTCGCRGSHCGGNHCSTWGYVYLVTPWTREDV